MEFRRTTDIYLMRENERLAAQAEGAQAQLDYICMMVGVSPLECDETGEGAEHGGAGDEDAL